jgi:integrase
VLKFSEGKGWIPYVPGLSSELLKKTKTSRRAWFSHAEYETLYKATRRRITEGKRPGYKSHYEDQHDYVLFMGNTGLRPDEAANLELRDINITYDRDTRETILDIDVRGKTGVGFCRSTANAVYPFQQLRRRRMTELRKEHPDATEAQIEALLARTKLFRGFKRSMFNAVLDEENLKFDRDGQRRTAYSLRHTYICFRLLEGADIRTVANNCRTSVEMIEEHYAAHIRHMISTKLLNTRKSSSARKGRKQPSSGIAEL